MNGAPFRDNVVVLTGASAGIGYQMALQLADQGARLVLAARDAARLEETAAECRRRGARAIVVPTDVAVEAECRALMDAAVAEFGRIDTLVNNAGVGMWALFEEMTDLAPIERIMQVNYLGSVYATFHALPHLKRTRGRIVVVNSLTGKTGVPTRSGYSASKHAVTGFFDTIRIELEDSGITVTQVFPGFVATEIRERAFGPDGKPLGTGNSPVQEREIMTADECARQIIVVAGKRKRELLMTLRGKIGPTLKLLAPRLVDRMVRKAIKKGK
ncbi:MAG TPA: SDR family oxidoreductase [Longimicrobium sp.]|nr:SDR family oxidoreductase [Longimicrobium sp.]